MHHYFEPGPTESVRGHPTRILLSPSRSATAVRPAHDDLHQYASRLQLAHDSSSRRNLSSDNLKGIVLSGGKATRLRPFSYTGAKQLVPIANKPILFYGIENLVQAGITDIAVIVGDTGPQVREALGDGSRFGAKLTFIEQDAPRGIAHAVKIARDFAGNDPFVVFLGDNFLRGGIVRFVNAFRDSGADAQILLTPVADASQVGVAVLDEAGRPVRLVEKPKEYVSRPRNHGHLYVQQALLRGRRADQALSAGRARDHGHDPEADGHGRRRPRRGRARALDRHR